MVSDKRQQAGESAQQVAARSRDKAERLEKRAQAFERGAAGEAETGLALAALDPAQWTVLHDVPWPGRKYANLDHVLVGPTGVYVVDTKNWSGRITISNGILRQNGYSRGQQVTGAIAAAETVAGVVPQLDPRLVLPVLCFTGGNHPVGKLPGVLVTASEDLVAQVTQRPPLLDAPAIREISMQLDVGLVRSWSPPSATVQSSPPPKPTGTHRHRAESRGPGRSRIVVMVGSIAAAVAVVGGVAPQLLQH